MKKKKLRRQIKKLKNLIVHCWVHSGHIDCGFRSMDEQQRKLYNKVIKRTEDVWPELSGEKTKADEKV